MRHLNGLKSTNVILARCRCTVRLQNKQTVHFCIIFFLLVDRALAMAYAHEVTISLCQNALILCTEDLTSVFGRIHLLFNPRRRNKTYS
jgi:hypothetical protein